VFQGVSPCFTKVNYFLNYSFLIKGALVTTKKQKLGNVGEQLVASKVDCPGCKKTGKSLRTLPTNFVCVDVICDFCGYLAQIKTKTVSDADRLPKQVPGAAWAPQSERMEAGIFFPLFLVLVETVGNKRSIWYLPPDLQTREMFTPRKPLRSTARRAGWQGYDIKLDRALAYPTRIL